MGEMHGSMHCGWYYKFNSNLRMPPPNKKKKGSEKENKKKRIIRRHLRERQKQFLATTSVAQAPPAIREAGHKKGVLLI